MKKAKQRRLVWEPAAAVILIPAVLVVFGWGAWKHPVYTQAQMAVHATEQFDHDNQRWLADFQQADKMLKDYQRTSDSTVKKSDLRKLYSWYRKTSSDLQLVYADAHYITGDVSEITNQTALSDGKALDRHVQQMLSDLQTTQTAFGHFVQASRSTSSTLISYRPDTSNLTTDQIAVDNAASVLVKVDESN